MWMWMPRRIISVALFDNWSGAAAAFSIGLVFCSVVDGTFFFSPIPNGLAMEMEATTGAHRGLLCFSSDLAESKVFCGSSSCPSFH